MPFDLQTLNILLDRVHTFSVEISADAPIPFNEPAYQILSDISSTGFSFTLRELFHAIGCKTAALPMSERDECIKSAWVFTHVLDLEASPLCFRPSIDSDLQTPRSQEIGIGMACLFASRFYQIPWDQLGPIAHKGKRFDYRGQNSNFDCIFESKATKYRSSQNGQVAHGVEKKDAHHSRGENYDVELIISTHVGAPCDIPRILIGDPPFENEANTFGEEATDFYLFRHFSRVMQFIGFPAYSWYLNQYAKSKFYYKSSISDYEPPRIEFPEFETVRRGGQEFVGRFYEDWVPTFSDRYKHLEKYKVPEVFSRKLRVFQGIEKSLLQQLFQNGPKGIAITGFESCRRFVEVSEEKDFSLFPDSTILFYDLQAHDKMR